VRKVAHVRQKVAFSVEHFSLSSYATQEVSGKFTIAGMFSDQVLVPEKAGNWPPLYIVMILVPQQRIFEYHITLKDDRDDEMISFEASYRNENEVDSRERLALCVPLPQFPMKNHGNYWFEISDGSRILLRRCYEFIAMEPNDVVFGQQTLKVRIGATGQSRVIQ